MRRLLPLALAALALVACGNDDVPDAGPAVDAGPADGGAQYVVEIDIDDHGLKALWSSPSPNLRRMIREGTLAFTRVDLPTHSNHNNMTLITGEWPEADNVPANSWLSRSAQPSVNGGPSWNAWQEPFNFLAGLGQGEYVFYQFNPLNQVDGPAHHVDSVWSTVAAAGLGPSYYVGQLPPWDVGADHVHYTVKDATLFGIPLDSSTITQLLGSLFHYPDDYVANRVTLDGPPTPAPFLPDGGPETIEHFTLRDAADVWQATLANGNPPPRYMFVWAFIALDGDPTAKYGADGDELASVVTDYDDAIGKLLAAIDASPYAGKVNILFTLDHGKVDTHKQVQLGNKGNDGQMLAKLVTAQGGPQMTPLQYDLLNEDGDALVYAKVPDAGSAYGYAQQMQVAHKLVDLIQGGSIQGVDLTRTLTWDGYGGTHTLHDNRIEGPNQADIIVFPQDDWTLGVVTGDGGAANAGTFDTTAHPFAFGRHGGYSEDELYVPLIMWGPSFRQGVVLPHPVNHADVAPTAMKILGQEIGSAQGAPILAAFRGDTAEAFSDPSDMTTARPTALTASGFHGGATLHGSAAQQVVVVDLAGVGFDEAFTDTVTSAHLPHLASLAASGVSFEAAWNRYRTVAENRFELLAGGTPVVDGAGNWIATAEADPGQGGAPGRGLLLEPAPPGVVPNPDALTAWRGSAIYASDSLVQAAQAAGFSAQVIGNAQALAAHTTIAAGDLVASSDADAAGKLSTFLGAHPQALAVVGLGQQARTADRHSDAALAELDALDAALAAVQQAAPGATLIVTSSNGADIDETAATTYGIQAARHVPLVIAGGPVRSGVVSGQPATAADIPATALFALGRPATTDFAEGTRILNPSATGPVPQAIPATATAGHVLGAAFTLQ
jgi:predicted AlkP superfamily pyrophosphatase or phosphodiesterase